MNAALREAEFGKRGLASKSKPSWARRRIESLRFWARAATGASVDIEAGPEKESEPKPGRRPSEGEDSLRK
jgi:hypothetical protein